MAIPVRRQFSRDPYWFDDYMFDPHFTARRLPSFEQEFGAELEPDSFIDQDEFLFPPPPPWFRQAMLSNFNNRSSLCNNRFGRLRRRGSIGGVGGPSCEVYCTRGKMQVTLDVTHFSPEELNVKLVDNYLMIEGKHDEKQEGRGFISRHFVRRYEIPAGSPDFEVKPEDVNCSLNSGGILSVEVQLEPPPPVDEEGKGNEKLIPINMTSTSSSSSSKQYRQHGHSSVHVKTTEDSAASSSAEFAT